MTLLVLLVVLGLWGSWAGPGWNLQPMKEVIVPETSDTSIHGTRVTTPISTFNVREELVDVPLSDGTTIPATIRFPEGIEGLAPGVVFIHGTGTSSYKDFDDEAELLSSSGIVTIVPQKRTTNYTTTHRDYEALAQDFSDVFEFLSTMPGVDPHRSGIYAVSEGCFIAPIVATMRDDVAFVAFISAPVLPIREQGALAAGTYLRNLGAPERIINAIPRLIGQDFGTDFEYIDFDVSMYQRSMTMPVLMLYGTGDMSMPTIQGATQMREDLAEAGNTNLTVRYYDKADHGLKVDKVLVTDAMRDTADWINGLPSTASASPHVAGAQPAQQYVAGSIGQPHWFASGEWGLRIMFAGLFLTIISIPLTLLTFVKWRGRRPVDLTGRAAKLNAASAGVLAAGLAAILYIVAIATLALSYQQNPVLVQGGWMLTELVALVAAWFVVREVFSVINQAIDKRDTPLPWPSKAIVCIAIAGHSIMLLTLAYWGFYPSPVG
ncbi:prolyl oligopeptidase family serine peptidase [Arcanobacterium haemolyticum]|nr:prolyl oligopeptidase family serine peptidase [Arcanobacterium haemolyticum]